MYPDGDDHGSGSDPLPIPRRAVTSRSSGPHEPGSDPAADGAAEAASLDALVRRTAGLQPWRRIFHALSGVAVAAGVELLDPGRAAVSAALGAVAVLLLAGDLVRLRSPALNLLFFRAFRSLASPREAGGVASSTWFVAGCALTVALFPRDVAVSAILVLALADPAAGYVGRRWGRRPFGKGTVEGSAVFTGVALGVLVAGHPFVPAGLAALGVTWIERSRWRLDDNLTVPLGTGALLTAFLLVAPSS